MVTFFFVYLFIFELDYENESSSPKLKVFARHLVPVDKVSSMKKMPFFLYLQVKYLLNVRVFFSHNSEPFFFLFQGGPGFECALPSSGTAGWVKVAFEKGYQVLLLDQRGTGLSSQISAESLELSFKTDEEKANYLAHFRADSIVRDCETIRKKLTEGRSKDDEQRISLLGQSFGGFCITTYLSLL